MDTMDTAAASTVEPGALRLAEQPTELIERVTRIWRDVLGHDLAPYEDFFDHGGTALDAVLVVNRAYKEFGADLRVNTVFEYPTVSAFVGVLVDHLTDAEVDAEIDAEAGRDRTPTAR